jgi:glutamate dehydrogenase (NAD(P)+)
MTTRWDETVAEHFCGAIERLTGKTLEPQERAGLVHGPSERDLVLSALENTMSRAFRALHTCTQQRKLPDLRVAAYLLSIDKVAQVYRASGIFP